LGETPIRSLGYVTKIMQIGIIYETKLHYQLI
jgi:hypothetical protein